MAQQLDHEHSHGQEAGARKQRAAGLSVGVNLLLIVVKVVVGLLSGSVAILAEAGHSLSDLSASVFAFWGIRQARKPPDDGYPYGHEKFENLSSLFQMLILAGITVFVFWEVAQALLGAWRPNITIAAIAVMALAIVVDFFTARYLHATAHEHGSAALEADAFHFVADMWSGVAALVGIVGARLGAAWMDPAAASVVALVMLYGAYRLGKKSTAALLDASPERAVVEAVRAVLDRAEAIGAYHSLRLRQAGNRVLLDVCIHVDAELSLGRAHEIAHELEARIQHAVPRVREAVVHVEPSTEHHHAAGAHHHPPHPSG